MNNTPPPLAATPASATDPNQPAPLPGTWTPGPRSIVDMAVAGTTVAFAEVPEEGVPMRVHLGTRVDGQWRWQPPWVLPFPPTLAAGSDLRDTSATVDVDATPEGVTVTINRIESQGGSHGIVMASLRNGTWVEVRELESPTDSDIAFGTPAIRRGDAVFTTEFEDKLWRYARDGAKWVGHAFALPRKSTFTFDPPMAVTPDASQVAIALAVAKSPQLAIFRRDKQGGYPLAASLPLPEGVGALAHVDSLVYVGFQRPTPDGSLVWALGPGAPERPEVVERIRLPAPGDPRLYHLSDLHASNHWVLIVQPYAVWVKRRLSDEAPRRLELPTWNADRPRHRVHARLAGSEAIVLFDDDLGVFKLE